MGENRDERISEFLEENDCPVLAMYEGRGSGCRGHLPRSWPGPALRASRHRSPFSTGHDVSWLLRSLAPRFDGRSPPPTRWSRPGRPGFPITYASVDPLEDARSNADRDRPVASSEPLLEERHVQAQTPPNLDRARPTARPPSFSRPTAIVYCEANFGAPDGKTANGLVRYSERYRIVAVVDSLAGRTRCRGGARRRGERDPDLADVDAAVTVSERTPDVVIFGVAPTSGMLSPIERSSSWRAMRRGMGVVNGLHEFLERRPRVRRRRSCSNGVDHPRRASATRARRICACSAVASPTGHLPRIAVLGTDGAIGKRTTATDPDPGPQPSSGSRRSWSAPGRPGLIQGARYGVALDAVPCAVLLWRDGGVGTRGLRG